MRKTTFLGILVWLIFLDLALMGVYLSHSLSQSITYRLIWALAFALAVFVWFLADTRERGHKPSAGLQFGVISMPVLAVPYYRFRHEGVKGGCVFVLKLISVVMVMTLVFGFVMMSVPVV